MGQMTEVKAHRSLACYHCSHVSETQNEARLHLATHPREDRKLTCPVCGKVMQGAGAYARHADAHKGAEAKFWSRVDKRGPDECWPWLWHVCGRGGYGKFVEAGKHRIAHRVAYELSVGPIPEGMTLDHTCHNADPDCVGATCKHRICMNPAHLEPIGGVENQRRALDTRTRVHHCRLCDFTTVQWPAFQSHMRHKHPSLYERKAKPVPAEASVSPRSASS